MKKPADDIQPSDLISEREKLIGLGKRSISKSYYPELKSRLDELEMFRALLDSVSDSILVVDTESGTILDASGSTEVMLGCPSQSLSGRPFADLLPPHIARYAFNLLHSSQNLSLETEFLCPTCSGCKSKPVEISLRTAEHQGKNRTVIVARDISERKRAEEALRQSHDELEIRVRERTRELHNANQVKTEFLSMVSHELRTPLTSVLGFAKIIHRKLEGSIEPAVEQLNQPKLGKDLENIFKNIGIIVAEAERLTALINDVLDLAKMEANKVDYNKKPVSPNTFIQRSIDVSSSLFMDSGLPLLVEIEEDMSLILADEDRLVQVMVNLFSNAVKFTESGTITCRARRVSDHIRVSVTDTGTGIPKEMRASIFEKFTQIESTLSDRPQGTGLGLPISRNIIESHFGHIWVEAPPSKGSKFIFTLPVIKE